MPGNDSPILNYADRDVGRWVPVTLYGSELVMHMVASMLEDAGIRTFIEDHPVRAGGSRPARVYVLADDAAAATELLKQAKLRHVPIAHEANQRRTTAERIFFVIQMLTLALIIWLFVLDPLLNRFLGGR